MDRPQKPPLADTRGRSPSAHGLGAVHEEDGRPFERRSAPGDEPPLVGSEREFILRTLRNELGRQTQEISGKLEASEGRTNERFRQVDERFLKIEQARLEDRETRIAMQEVTAQVRHLLAHDRAQDLDIGALQARVTTNVAASLRPQVLADATTEGQAAGYTAGARQSKIWGVLTLVVATVVTTSLGYCQRQIENGAFSSPAKK